jgi:hypothetical protein
MMKEIKKRHWVLPLRPLSRGSAPNKKEKEKVDSNPCMKPVLSGVVVNKGKSSSKSINKRREVLFRRVGEENRVVSCF